HNNFYPFTGSIAYALIPRSLLKTFLNLQKQIFTFLSGIEFSEEMNLPLDYLQETSPSRAEVLYDLANDYPDNDFLAKLFNIDRSKEKQKLTIDIFSMKEIDLIKCYYEGLQKKYGTANKIAKISGKAKSTIYGTYKRLGIPIK
ncbi:MAG: hypothetical protein ABSC11_13105, partial [Smithella sp.]